jgi:hypothetical protein
MVKHGDAIRNDIENYAERRHDDQYSIQSIDTHRDAVPHDSEKTTPSAATPIIETKTKIAYVAHISLGMSFIMTLEKRRRAS